SRFFKISGADLAPPARGGSFACRRILYIFQGREKIPGFCSRGFRLQPGTPASAGGESAQGTAGQISARDGLWGICPGTCSETKQTPCRTTSCTPGEDLFDQFGNRSH